MAPAAIWTRNGDSLRCCVRVHPSQQQRLVDYARHRLRLLCASTEGLLHAEEAVLTKDELVLRLRSRSALAEAVESCNDVHPWPGSHASWRRRVILPALQAMLSCHQQGIVGFAPLWPVQGRWVPPVGWFMPALPGAGQEGAKRADLRHAAAWLRNEQARQPGTATRTETDLLSRLTQMLEEGESDAAARLLAGDRRLLEAALSEDPDAPSFLTLLTEAELLERLTSLSPYRLLPEPEARSDGADPRSQRVLELDTRWRDPHFPKLDRPTPQELWDELIEESRTTPVLAVADRLPNPLSAEVDPACELRWIGVHPDQPLLYVPRTKGTLPQRGFLWLHQAGDNTLMARKRIFTHFAGDHQALEPALESAAPSRAFERNPQPRDGLEAAILAARGVFAVQGPPGTGKTYLATQVVRRFLERTPAGRVLVCAKEHFALDNILRSVTSGLRRDKTAFRAFRSVSLAKLRRRPSEVDASFLAQTVMRELAGYTFAPEASGWIKLQAATLAQHDLRLRTLAEDAANLFFCTTMDAAMTEFIGRASFDLVIIEEAGKCYPSELLHAICLGQTVLMIGDHRQLPPFQEKQTRDALQAWQEVLSPGRTERDRELEARFGETYRQLAALIDRRGPLTSEQIQWLRPFEYLFDRLPTRHRLEEQFRMEEPLSRLIGTVFYGRPFEHRKGELVQKGLLPADPLAGVLPDGLNVPLLWINTPHMSVEPAAAESSGVRESTYERDVVIGYLKQLRPARKIDMVLLTPYNAQKRLFLQDGELRGLCEKLTDIPFEQVVRTTDEYQGREAELTVLSLVRNNALGRHAWGFMTEPERLNVMFSRTRFRQVVVACGAHIERHAAEAPYLHAVWQQYQQEAARDRTSARVLRPEELDSHG